MIIIVLAANALRWWYIAALGQRCTTRVIACLCTACNAALRTVRIRCEVRAIAAARP
jgi:isoprenylcysteine carboxyl methyltransferase (ICMT) family protein YpbQ